MVYNSQNILNLLKEVNLDKNKSDDKDEVKGVFDINF